MATSLRERLTGMRIRLENAITFGDETNIGRTLRSLQLEIDEILAEYPNQLGAPPDARGSEQLRSAAQAQQVTDESRSRVSKDSPQAW